MNTSKETVAGVELLQVLGQDFSVGIVFLHGYGANMHDLFPLWELWHAEKFNWYFPNGLQPLSMGPYGGRAWFSIDLEELDRANREGRARDLKNSVPPEFDSTLMTLDNLVAELSTRHKTIILGGFSQGAMCAAHLALRPSLHPDGLVLLSGALLAEERVPSKARGIPFYQSHGRQDPILSIGGARDLEERLRSLQFQGTLTEFSGGHEIPPSVLGEVKSFLRQFI